MTSLIFGFIVKHFLADLFLQTSWINKGKRKKRGWLEPMLAHCWWHSLGTLFVVAFYLAGLDKFDIEWVWLISGICAIIDGISHGIIDRIKIKVLEWWLPESYPKYLVMNILDQGAHFSVYTGILLSIYSII